MENVALVFLYQYNRLLISRILLYHGYMLFVQLKRLGKQGVCIHFIKTNQDCLELERLQTKIRISKNRILSNLLKVKKIIKVSVKQIQLLPITSCESNMPLKLSMKVHFKLRLQSPKPRLQNSPLNPVIEQSHKPRYRKVP